MRLCILSLAAALPFVPAPAKAQIGEAEVFLSLCVDGGLVPSTGQPPDLFPDAVPISADEVLADLPQGLPIDVVEAWDLVPDTTAGNRAAIVLGRMEHPTLGAMATCTILFRWARTMDLHEGLVSAGAAQEAGLFYLESGGRLWMIDAIGMPANPTGEGIITGMVQQEPAQ